MPSACRIAVPLTSAEPPLDEQVRAAIAHGADLIELRVDCIGDTDAVERLLRRPHDRPYILTVRAANEGGHWDGSDAERIALIEHLGLLQPGYVDIEYATWQRSANLRQKIGLVAETSAPSPRPRNKLILSRHDFTGTPAELGEWFAALAATPADVIKVACMPADATDAVRILEQLRRYAGERAVIALSMGEAGLITRVLARKFGALLTFASPARQRESAPGQPTLAELQERFHWARLGAATRVYGVVGWPTTHSRSPDIHNAALGADGIDGVYVPLPVRPTAAAFTQFMDRVVASDWLDLWGLSVTIPHKEHALAWLDARGWPVSGLARRCGAVNTLTRQADGTWSGDNTDCAGVLAALATLEDYRTERLAGHAMLVLGAGGAARAAAAALAECGAHVTVTNRTPARAEALAAELGVATCSWERRSECAADVIINCTSVGLSPATDETPYPAQGLREGQVVFDTAYNPPRTRLLREAAAAGARPIEGTTMFLGQAAAQYRSWHGVDAPLGAMGAALSQALS